MTEERRKTMIQVPKGKVDVVIDTDAYNEIDDQFAISYLLRSAEKLRTAAIYAAPFFNQRSESPKDGMEKSYAEIQKLLRLAGEEAREAESYAHGTPWTRVIWDVTAVTWLLNDDERFMKSRLVRAPLPTYENTYEENPDGATMCYVYHIERDVLMTDLLQKLTK